MRNNDVDSELVLRAKHGDRAAFDVLVAKHQYRIKILVAKLVKNDAEQDDVVQESFIRAYHGIGDFRGESAFYTWLYRIAVNTAKNHLVRQKRRPHGTNIDDADEVMPKMPRRLVENNTPEAIAQNKQLLQGIRDSILKLPATLRQAIMLREVDGLSYENISLQLDCPVGTVRSRIFRARAIIAKATQPLLD